MESCKSVNTALLQELGVKNDKSGPFDDAILSGQLPGSILHSSNTVRPELALAGGYLSQCMHQLTRTTWKARKNVARSLSGTKELGDTYGGSEGEAVLAISDADWSGERPTRKSSTGTVHLYAGGAIYWRSRQQSMMAQRSKESELIAL